MNLSFRSLADSLHPRLLQTENTQTSDTGQYFRKSIIQSNSTFIYKNLFWLLYFLLQLDFRFPELVSSNAGYHHHCPSHHVILLQVPGRCPIHHSRLVSLEVVRPGREGAEVEGRGGGVDRVSPSLSQHRLSWSLVYRSLCKTRELVTH